MVVKYSANANANSKKAVILYWDWTKENWRGGSLKGKKRYIGYWWSYESISVTKVVKLLNSFRNFQGKNGFKHLGKLIISQ